VSLQRISMDFTEMSWGCLGGCTLILLFQTEGWRLEGAHPYQDRADFRKRLSDMGTGASSLRKRGKRMCVGAIA
jgi:hypothetical protein